MTVVTTRPDADIANSGAVAQGGASAHAVLADDSDATYLEFDNQASSTVGFAEPSAPAGSVISKIAIRLRADKTISYSPILSAKLDGTGAIPNDRHPWSVVAWTTLSTIWWTTPITYAPQGTVGGGSAATADVTAVPMMATPTGLTLAFQRLDAGGNDGLRIFAAYVDTTYVEKPVVAVTGPTGSSASTSPTVEWTDTLDADGGEQIAWELKVFTDAVYGAGGFDPNTSTAAYSAGAFSSARSVAVSAVLADDTYRAYVRVSQAVNGSAHKSDWAYSTFTVSAPRPATPTLVATAEPDDGRNKLELADPGGGAVSTDYFAVERSTDGGATFDPMRTDLEGGYTAPVAGAAVLYDREAGNGEEITYRARAVHGTTPWLNPAVTFGSWSTSDAATWTDTAAFWIKHPTTAALDCRVVPQSQPGQSRAARRGVFQALGRDDAVVIADTYEPWQGELVLISQADDETDAIDAIIADGSPLLIQAPATANFRDRWISVGDHSRARGIDRGWGVVMIDTLPWTEVRRPTTATV